MKTKQQNTSIPIIDLFAGPGGLGEGFASFDLEKNELRLNPFIIALSVEMEKYAHQTLLLRSFFRKFPKGEVPDEYYEYLKGYITKEELFAKFPRETSFAVKEAVQKELGKDQEINALIDQALEQFSGQEKVLIGGPPCQAYSLIGRSRMNENGEAYEKDKRHLLYKEYLKVIVQIQPAVFVMENVKGILSSRLKGERIFPQIVRDFNSPSAVLERSDLAQLSYKILPFESSDPLICDSKWVKPSDFIVRSEKYGIPQTRHRVILLGIRSDIFQKIHKKCFFLAKHTKRKVSLSNVLSDLPKVRSTLSRGNDSASSWKEAILSIREEIWYKNLECKELRRFMQNQLEQLENSMAPTSENQYLQKKERDLIKEQDVEYAEWYYDPKLNGYLNHQPKSHMKEDLHRYFFAACYSKVHSRSPKLQDFPLELLPNHNNVKNGSKIPIFSDRFRVQLNNEPASTITSHMAKDGHYYIHPDSWQCRSLTVREAARIQTFPDNYFFEGPRTAQYRQVGNAVPPLLAKQIANVVFQIFQEAGLI